jgi:hypothetical protein
LQQLCANLCADHPDHHCSHETASLSRLAGDGSPHEVGIDRRGEVPANAELFRQYKGFADPVPTAADAPIFDRVLALSGRNPAWAPSAH